MQDPLLLSGQLPASRSTWAPSQTTFPWPRSLGKGRSPMWRACHQEGSPKSLGLQRGAKPTTALQAELREAGERACGLLIAAHPAGGEGPRRLKQGFQGRAGPGASGRIQRKRESQPQRRGLGGNPRLGPNTGPPAGAGTPAALSSASSRWPPGIQTHLPKCCGDWEAAGRRGGSDLGLPPQHLPSSSRA